MIIIFIGLISCVLLAFFIINMNFLEPYYISNKKTEFVKMYDTLNEAMKKGTISTRKQAEELWHIAEKNNLSYLIVDEMNSQVFTNVHDMDMLERQLAGYLLNQAQKDSKILDSTDEYQLTRSRNPWNKEEYIEMWGTFEDGSRFLIRSPIESIRESADISNRFLAIIGSFMVMICAVLIWYFSKKLTDPILELAALSERMANLDFEAEVEDVEQTDLAR